MCPLKPEQCRELFDQCKTNRLGDVVTLAIMTRLRLREIFVIDLSAGNPSEDVLSVRKTMEELSKKVAEATGSGRLNEKPRKTPNSKQVVTLEPIAIKPLTDRMEKTKAEEFDPSKVPIVFPNTFGRRLPGSSCNAQCWIPIQENSDSQTLSFTACGTPRHP